MLCSETLLLLAPRREKKEKVLFMAFRRRSPLCASTRLHIPAAVRERKTRLLDAKTENRRSSLRAFALTYILHSSALLLCRSGLCEAKEKPLTIHKMYFFRLYSVVLSTHNANLAKKSLWRVVVEPSMKSVIICSKTTREV